MQSDVIAGIDEAGRGPLVGDMFIALVVVEKQTLQILENLGVKDSKKLTKNRREQLFSSIISLSKLVVVHRIAPHQIDEYNVNELEMIAIVEMAKKALQSTPIREIYVDAFTAPDRIIKRLSHVANNVELHVEFNADRKYLAVAAASIVAKVLRDRHIDLLKNVYGDLGSGYPSDAKTIEWLRSYYVKFKTIPPIVRKSWKTIERVLNIKTEPKRGKTLLEYIESKK
uniref:Ribonuclease HII n=1 Tax=Ignisphaera aggregans TaxID=334771 RepID=A0A7C4BE29_9CREN